MNSFRANIYSRTLELLAELPGGVHWGICVPRGGTWKSYAILTPFTAPTDGEDTGSETIESRTIRFQIFTDGLESAGELTELLYKGFRKYEADLVDGNTIKGCYKDSEDCFLDPDRWSDGAEIWVGVLQLVFVVQRSIPAASV